MRRLGLIFLVWTSLALPLSGQLQYTSVPRNGEGRFNRSTQAVFWANYFFDIDDFGPNGGGAEFTFDADGEFGIGANNPLARLHIRANGSELARFESGGNYWSVFTIDGTGNLELFQNGIFKGRFLESDGTYTTTSDKKYKDNIQSLENVLDRILQLRPTTYGMKHSNSRMEHIGFIAQEVAEIFPQLVYLGPTGNSGSPAYTMNYNSMSVVAIKGIQELAVKEKALEEEQGAMHAQLGAILKENHMLKQELAEVKDLLKDLKQVQQSCCQLNSLQTIDLKGEDRPVSLQQTAILEQNIPNPFLGETKINYFLPDHIQQAFLTISDANGRMLKQVNLEGRGKGAVVLHVDQFPPGVYTYTLFVDSQKIGSRQMVIGKDR